jgi:hypothetical protein
LGLITAHSSPPDDERYATDHGNKETVAETPTLPVQISEPPDKAQPAKTTPAANIVTAQTSLHLKQHHNANITPPQTTPQRKHHPTTNNATAQTSPTTNTAKKQRRNLNGVRAKR